MLYDLSDQDVSDINDLIGLGESLFPSPVSSLFDIDGVLSLAKSVGVPEKPIIDIISGKESEFESDEDFIGSFISEKDGKKNNSLEDDAKKNNNNKH